MSSSTAFTPSASQKVFQPPSTSTGSYTLERSPVIQENPGLNHETSSLTVNYETDCGAESISSYQLPEEEIGFSRKSVGRLASKSDHPDSPDELGSLLRSEKITSGIWAAGWNVAHHHTLPDWLKDNDFLLRGHRVPTNSFLACFKSIFRIHTETGNIWTHLLGMIAFLGIAAYFLSRPSIEIQWQEKAVFSAFFMGAILCLGFSWVFHTVYCHSERVGRFFNKLDYCGIALLTIGSFVPWLYYSFYCRLEPKVTYLALIFFLGTICIVVSMWDKFAQPQYRPLRAGVFVALGLSGVVPAMHYVITDGFWHAINFAALGWLVLMALLYIVGAVIYAVRIPERIFPGKFDIWVTALAQQTGDPCTTDSDCHDGCCLLHGGSMTCTTLAKLNQPCDLDGHSHDACPCENGLICEPPTQPDHHLGTCVSH